MLLAFLVFFSILSFLIIIHELGHFLMARKFGVEVEEFGWGYPPKIWGKKFGKTLYSINLIPFGGFVRIAGSDYDENYKPENKNNFAAKNPGIKILILTGGIIMNFIVASVLYYAFFAVRNFKSLPIVMLEDHKFPYGQTETLDNIIVFVDNQDTPFKMGDQVIKISSKSDPNVFVYPKYLSDITGFVGDKKEQPLVFDVKNIQTDRENEVVANTYFSKELNRYIVGIGLGKAVTLNYSKTSEKLLLPFLHSANILSYSFSAINMLFKTSVETKNIEPAASSLTGPVGVFFIVESILKLGGKPAMLTLLDFTAMLSLSLAVMNIIPFPALDGGHLAFVMYEIVKRKPMPLKAMRWISNLGMIFLLTLAVLIAFKDYFTFR